MPRLIKKPATPEQVFHTELAKVLVEHVSDALGLSEGRCSEIRDFLLGDADGETVIAYALSKVWAGVEVELDMPAVRAMPLGSEGSVKYIPAIRLAVYEGEEVWYSPTDYDALDDTDGCPSGLDSLDDTPQIFATVKLNTVLEKLLRFYFGRTVGTGDVIDASDVFAGKASPNQPLPTRHDRIPDDPRAYPREALHIVHKEPSDDDFNTE